MSATKVGQIDAAAFCVAGVVLSAPQARFASKACRFQHLTLDLRGRQITFSTCIAVCRSLATKLGQIDAAAFCLAGVTLSAPQARLVWQAWHFQQLRLDLRDRRGAFSNSMKVRGSLATKVGQMTPLHFAWHSAPQARLAWQTRFLLRDWRDQKTWSFSNSLACESECWMTG